MATSEPLSLRDQVKRSVSSVLAAFPVGIPLHVFLKEFNDLEGKHLPFRDLGYNSPAKLLESFSDVVRVVETSTGQKVIQGIPNEKAAHIYKFVQHQNTKMNKSAKKVKELLRNVRPTQRPNVVNSSAQRTETRARPEVPPPNPKYIEQKIYPLLRNYPSGLPFNQLGPLFQQHYSQNFNVSLEQFLSMVPNMEFLNVRKVTDQSGTSYKIFWSRLMKTDPVSPGEWGIPDEVRLKVRKVVDVRRDGVVVHDFYEAYHAVNKEPLKVQPMGFPCLMEFLETLDQKVIWLDRSRPDSVRVLPLRHQTVSPAVKASVSAFSSGATSREAIDVSHVSPSRERGSHKAITVSFSLGNLIREELPRAALEGKPFSIKIGCVLHPGNFWWSLAESTRTVVSLEHEMTNFYESPTNQNLVLLSNEIEAGQLVAAKSTVTFHWQRALVISCAMESQYFVRFVDHGDLQKVALAQLRPLISKFTILPVQAKKSRLHGMQIPDSGWPDQILQQFKALLYNGPLEARFVSVEEGREPCFVVELMRGTKVIGKEIFGDIRRDAEEIVNEELVTAVKQIDISSTQRLHIVRLANDKPFLVSRELAALTLHGTLETLKSRLKEQYSSQVFVCRRNDFPRVLDELTPILDSAPAAKEIELLPVKFALQVLAFHGCSNPRVFSLLKEEVN